MADQIIKFVVDAGSGYHGQSLLVIRPIVRRIRDDDELWKTLMGQLDAKTNPWLKGDDSESTFGFERLDLRS